MWKVARKWLEHGSWAWLPEGWSSLRGNSSASALWNIRSCHIRDQRTPSFKDSLDRLLGSVSQDQPWVGQLPSSFAAIKLCMFWQEQFLLPSKLTKEVLQQEYFLNPNRFFFPTTLSNFYFAYLVEIPDVLLSLKTILGKKADISICLTFQKPCCLQLSQTIVWSFSQENH